MSALLFLLTACSSCVGLPEEVPSQVGTLDAAALPDLLTAASPDTPVLLWLAVGQLSNEDYRDCPLIYTTSSSISIDAGGSDGCLDSAGVRWQGSASVVASGNNLVFSFEDFGPVSGVNSPWTALGTVFAEPTPTGAGIRLTTRLALSSLDPGGPKSLWLDTKGSLSDYDGLLYMEHFYGTVGVEGWGTTEIDGNRVPLSLVNGCPYGQHFSGSIGLFAENTGAFTFRGVEVAEGPPAPPAEGSGDTAGGGSNGDTGGGGGGGGGGAGDLEIPSPSGTASGYCGECVVATVDGSTLDGCVAVERSVDWPFYDAIPLPD